jgi:hypothetical protein
MLPVIYRQSEHYNYNCLDDITKLDIENNCLKYIILCMFFSGWPIGWTRGSNSHLT